MHRRQFLYMGAAAGLSAAAGAVAGNAATGRLMTMDLVCGAIGVRATLAEAIELAARHGFESVGGDMTALAAMGAEERQGIAELLRSKGLKWGAAGLPVEFRRDEETFRKDMEKLGRSAAAWREVGGTRVGTWIMPNHDTLTYLQNLRQHVERLRETADILADHGLRLGLEYVGPKTSWTARRFPFIHTMAEMKDLLEGIDRSNVGFILDSWHWYTAGEQESDLLSLTHDQVVAVDLNDAPAGIPVDQQMDLKRKLPTATGVIDVRTFLRALIKIGYDGPVRAEPFDESLNGLPADEAVARTAAAMKAAFALI
ncbi:MAG: sugar phosphate isomerase/epimerase [Acidobacteriota bacterium]